MTESVKSVQKAESRAQNKNGHRAFVRAAALLMVLVMLTGFSACGEDSSSADGKTLIYGSGDYTAINPALYEHGKLTCFYLSGLRRTTRIITLCLRHLRAGHMTKIRVRIHLR